MNFNLSSTDLLAKIIIEELYRNNISTFAISPGARSVPLIKAIKQNDRLTIKLFNDERSAGFWASGYAKATGSPCVLLATSGTAVANYLPSIIEAYYSNTPLFIITCDRPYELKNGKANQTIAQENIFKDFVKLNINIPAFENKIFPESVLADIDQLINTTKSGHCAPVHLNISFRKPFSSLENSPPQNEIDFIERWFRSKKPYNSYLKANLVPTQSAQELLINLINESKKPLIIAGPLVPYTDNSSILDLGKKIKSPILADINSCLRGNDTFSLYNAYIDKCSSPDLIILFGDRIVSENLKNYIKSSNAKVIQVSSYPWRQDCIENDFLKIDFKVICEPESFAKILQYKLNAKNNLDYLKEVENFEADSFEKLSSLNFSEASSIIKILNSNNPDINFFISSSLILREAENFFKPNNYTKIICNRGVVGIDGVVSSALGYNFGRKQKTFLLIGDQAFMHDLNSLSLLKDHNLHIFLINNGGGAIFNILQEDDIEKILINKQNELDYKKLIESFGINYQEVQSLKDLESRLDCIDKFSNSSITELKFNGKESAKEFQNLWEKV